MMHYFISLLILIAASSSALAEAPDAYFDARQRMVSEIVDDVVETASQLGRERLNPRVLDAMKSVKRHEFVPPENRKRAYKNRPLPIGHGQTISQPYMVAIMTDLLDLDPGDKVLEVGTGSGYQAAILAELVDRVYSIEIIAPLGKKAAQRLKRLNYDNVDVRIGDGYYGWKEQAPFDAIIVTAAGSHIPPPLIKQLKPGGRMVVPVGSRFMTQELLLVEKNDAGDITTRQLLPVIFVPLTGSH
jgi:protein-L-isoaspartate(D-aspartate) O-methyltransferase